ncbi:MAG TPA: hypothetical protein ENG58_00890 [Thermotogales bacterium]|nr:hypothetical protein [Thermotogales bacterium]
MRTLNLLHLTHKNVDPDGFAGVVWGREIFGGSLHVDSPGIVVRRLIERFKISTSPTVKPDVLFIYDVNLRERVGLPEGVELKRYVIFDHHPKYEREFFEGSIKFFHKPRSALVLNLFDYSEKAGLHLSDDLLLIFAVALVTDTALLRTATGEELTYLGYFLKKRRLEEVFEIIMRGRLSRDILKRAEKMRMYNVYGMKVGILEVADDDEFHLFIDVLFEPLGLDVIVGDTNWGSWVFTRKRLLQKINKIFKDSGFEWNSWGRIEGKKWWEILRTLENSLGGSDEKVKYNRYDH